VAPSQEKKEKKKKEKKTAKCAKNAKRNEECDSLGKRHIGTIAAIDLSNKKKESAQLRDSGCS